MQVIFGGRNGVGYFNDVWAFRLSTGVWEEWTPSDGNAVSPMGRDHFGAVYDTGHMYIFGELLKLSTCCLVIHAAHVRRKTSTFSGPDHFMNMFVCTCSFNLLLCLSVKAQCSWQAMLQIIWAMAS